MRVCFAPHTTDIPETIQPYIESLLERYDAVIVSPYMGVEQFSLFGARVIVDCRPKPDLRSTDSCLAADYEHDAIEAGLSVLVCEGHVHELEEK